MRRSFVEFQSYATPPVPDAGGYLESKNGEVCLRMGDEVAATLKGFMVRRSWRRPGESPFDPQLYPTRIGGGK